MAVFLLKAKTASATCRRRAPAMFADVPCPSTFADWIEALVRRGNHRRLRRRQLLPDEPGAARPDGGLPAQDRARLDVRPAAPAPGAFGDVACPSHVRGLDRAARRRGGDRRLRRRQLLPAQSNNTRGQMAVFITKTFSLQ